MISYPCAPDTQDTKKYSKFNASLSYRVKPLLKDQTSKINIVLSCTEATLFCDMLVNLFLRVVSHKHMVQSGERGKELNTWSVSDMAVYTSNNRSRRLVQVKD